MSESPYTAVVFAYHDVGVRCLAVMLAHGVKIPLVVTHRDDPGENVWFESVEKLAREHLSGAEERAVAMKDFKLTITAKAGTEGKLFGSIGTSDVAEAATKAGFKVAYRGPLDDRFNKAAPDTSARAAPSSPSQDSCHSLTTAGP